jgi:hypothetical protein
MKKTILNCALPMALAMLTAGPAFSQVRVGVDLGSFDVRFAQDAPPPMRFEHRSPSPGPGNVWIGGFWDRDGDRWAWREGRWDRGHGGDRWVSPVYRRENSGYRYEPGHWNSQRMHEGDEYRQQRDHGRRP